MGWKRSEAFVLRAIPLGETDRIVSLLTREEGRIRGVARNARRSRRRFGGSLELLSRVRATWFEREGAELVRVESCELLESQFPLVQGSLEIAFLLNYLAELAEAFSRERDPDRRFFRLLGSCLAAARAGADPGRLARYFEIWTLRLHGMLADLEACSRCGRDLAAGAAALPGAGREILCSRCRPPGGEDFTRLRGSDLRWIRRLLRSGPGEICMPGAPDPPGPGLARYAHREIEGYLEQPLRSYRFLASGGPAR